MTIAIGIEEDRVADPHRIARRTRSFSDALCGVVLQVENVELISLAAAVALSALLCFPQCLPASPITFAFSGTLLEPVNGSSTFSGFFTVNSNPNPQTGFSSVTEQGSDVSATLNIGGQVIDYANTPQNTQFVEAMVNTQEGIPIEGTPS